MAEGNGVDLVSVHQMPAHLTKTAVRLEDQAARTDEQRTLVERDMKHSVADLNQTVALYHASIMDHGMFLVEHDERIAWLEDLADARPRA